MNQVLSLVGKPANPRPSRLPRHPILIPDRVAERAATRYIEDQNGCYISTYSVASHGYAQVGWQTSTERHVVLAHRATWVFVNGQQIPAGMTIDHLCKERRCVNPEHLRLLTNFENARRTAGRDWPVGTCRNGHSNDLLVLVDGGRRWRCKICNADQKRRYREKVRQRAA